MSNRKDFYVGISSLFLATILWGSSFPVIKIVIGNIDSFFYTWFRSLLAVLIFLPYILCKFLNEYSLDRKVISSGLITGIAYCLGLWLQAWGTKYTTATNSAFITGLNVVFVHLYVALVEKRYDVKLLIELVLSVTGLYLLTQPITTFYLGDILVLLGAIAWAFQIILVSKYGGKNPIFFTFFELIPSIFFIIPDIFLRELELPHVSVILGLTYLALFCTVIAFTLQAYGQKIVNPEVAAMIYLFEPILATFFSWLILGEYLTMLQALGASLIMISIVLATASTSRR